MSAAKATYHDHPSTTNPEAAQPESTKLYPLPETHYEEIVKNPFIFFQNLHSFTLAALPSSNYSNKQDSFVGSVGWVSLKAKNSSREATIIQEPMIPLEQLLVPKLKHKYHSFKIPTLGGKALDLHRLFVEVTSRGGLEKVIQDLKWKEIIGTFNFPSTITSGTFILRKFITSRKKAPSILSSDSAKRIVNGSASLHGLLDGVVINPFPANQNIEAGCSVTRIIDAKFDNGYLITVNVGSEQLKGVLYHTPSPSQASNFSAAASGTYMSCLL